MMEDEEVENVNVHTPSAKGGCLIYIDNSNIWINTMHYSSHRLKFINDVYDHRIRVKITKLINFAAADRPILRCVLYGSEPPPVTEFWNNLKTCKVEVQVTKRSTYNNREREVDQNINLDIGEDIVIHREHAKYNGTVILFTGDGGMYSAVRRAVKYNWNVEIWSYKASLAKLYTDEVDNDKVKIRLLDDLFDEFAYYTLEFRNTLPPERSFVITFKNLPIEKRGEILKIFVETATKILKLPISGRFVRNKRNNSNEETTEAAHLALVCIVHSQTFKEDSRCDLPSPHQPPQQDQNRRRNISLNFNDDSWHKILDLLYEGFSEVEKSTLYEMTKTLKTGLQTILADMIKINSEEIKSNKRYDFNKDIYQKVEKCLVNYKYYNSENKTDRNPIQNAIKKYKPIVRSLPQFLQDMRLVDIHDITLEAPAYEDEGDDGFHVVNRRHPRKKCQKYSDPCKFGFRCLKGFKCVFAHSDKEIEFFKLQPEAQLRTAYKLRECSFFQKNICKYRGPLSYLCPFAHGLYCQTCKCDEDYGHDLKACPCVGNFDKKTE